MQLHIVIIGSSIAGLSAAEAARQKAPDCRITILSEDTHFPYFRQRLAEVLTDRSKAEKLFLHPESWYTERGFDLKLNHKVTGIDPENKAVFLENGAEIAYDKLILATGSASFVPKMPGAELLGVETLWTMEDALRIESKLRDAKRGIVIGGGLLGLEAASAMRERGLETQVLERLPRLMMRQLDERSAGLFTAKVESEGIRVMTQACVKEIYGDEKGRVQGIRLEDGQDFPCDLVLVSAGVMARAEYLKDSGVVTDRKIIVDDRMRTNVPDIFAAGDCAVMDGRWYGLWMIAKQQGQVAGENTLGLDTRCVMQTPPYMVKTMGTQIVSSGLIEEGGLSEDHQARLRVDITENSEAFQYSKKLYIDGHLGGFVLLGDTKAFTSLLKEMKAPE